MAFSSRLLGLAAASLLLTGCMTQERYETVSTALEGSASLRAKAVNSCASGWSRKGIQSAALITDLPASRAPRAVCQRTVNAMASGKLTYADMNKLRSGDMSPKVIRILQGR